MDATALRASTQAATGTTIAGTTNGPSSGTATTGGGPVAAPTQPVLLGERLLPAPAGEPQTIHLNDGSMLVPVARVDASGNRVPLAGGPGSARLATAPAAAAPAAAPAIAPAAAAPAAAQATGGGAAAPIALLYNDLYFKQYFSGGNGFDSNNPEKVRERAIESTILYLHDKEPNVDDFGITAVDTRPVDAGADADLLKIDPNAKFVIDVKGVQGDGVARSIPSVMNHDGTTYTDPRIGRS
jgi:hypothetical protein